MATWCCHSGGVCWEVSKASPECCCAGCRQLLFLPYSTCSFRAGSKSLSRRAAKIKKSVFPKPLVRRLAACQNLQCSANPTGLIMAARFLKLREAAHASYAKVCCAFCPNNPDGCARLVHAGFRINRCPCE